MMNDLNTLVQFLSAIYLTITIDNLMFNRFWTADLYSLTEKSLYEFDFCLSSPKKKALLDVIKSRAVITEQIARRRGGYFLLFCLSLLVFFSLETSLNSELRAVAHFFFIPTLMFVGIEYIIGIFRWNSWKRIFIYYSFVVIFFVVGITVLMNIDTRDLFFVWTITHESTIILIDKILTICILIVPIVVRLYSNWLNSVVFVRYINNKLGDESQAYQKTKNAIKTKEQSNCDPRYDEVYKKVYFSGNGSEDSMETGLVDKLVELLEELCKPLSVWTLIKYRYSKNFKNTLETKATPIEVTTYTLPAGTREKFTKVDYAPYMDEYRKLTGKKIKDFCAEKGIDENAFKAYRKNHI